MKTSILLCAILLCGCARFTTNQSDTSYDEQGLPQRTITTRASAFTFFTARSQLASFRASQTDKTQSATVGGLSQTSDGSNVVSIVEAGARGAVAGALGK